MALDHPHIRHRMTHSIPFRFGVPVHTLKHRTSLFQENAITGHSSRLGGVRPSWFNESCPSKKEAGILVIHIKDVAFNDVHGSRACYAVYGPCSGLVKPFQGVG